MEPGNHEKVQKKYFLCRKKRENVISIFFFFFAEKEYETIALGDRIQCIPTNFHK